MNGRADFVGHVGHKGCFGLSLCLFHFQILVEFLILGLDVADLVGLILGADDGSYAAYYGGQHYVGDEKVIRLEFIGHEKSEEEHDAVVEYVAPPAVVKHQYGKANPKDGHHDEGYGKGGVGRFIESKMCQGDYYICMYNENIHDRLHVIVRAVAVVEIKDYQYVEYDRIKINPRYVTLHKQRMRINTYQVRVPIE